MAALYDSVHLPDTRDEILALAKVLNADPERDVFLGRQASREMVKLQDLSKTRIIAFATHGLLPGEFPGVDQPALALANPGNGQHGLLTLDEILGLKLDADWVVLSACNTAAGDGAGARGAIRAWTGFSMRERVPCWQPTGRSSRYLPPAGHRGFLPAGRQSVNLPRGSIRRRFLP